MLLKNTCARFVICSMMNIRKERNMKYITVSGLGFLLVLPAFAGARLPAVNVSAGVNYPHFLI